MVAKQAEMRKRQHPQPNPNNQLWGCAEPIRLRKVAFQPVQVGLLFHFAERNAQSGLRVGVSPSSARPTSKTERLRLALLGQVVRMNVDQLEPGTYVEALESAALGWVKARVIRVKSGGRVVVEDASGREFTMRGLQLRPLA
eukprot:g75243.t1